MWLQRNMAKGGQAKRQTRSISVQVGQQGEEIIEVNVNNSKRGSQELARRTKHLN